MALSNLHFRLVHLCRSQPERTGGTTAQMSAEDFFDPSFSKERVQNAVRPNIICFSILLFIYNSMIFSK